MSEGIDLMVGLMAHNAKEAESVQNMIDSSRNHALDNIADTLRYIAQEMKETSVSLAPMSLPVLDCRYDLLDLIKQVENLKHKEN